MFGIARLNTLAFAAAAAPTGRTAVTLTAVGNAKISTAQSKFSSSSYIGDGTGDYITVGTQTLGNFGSSDFTVECWVRTSAQSTYMTIMSHGWNFSNNNKSWWLYQDISNKIGFRFYNGTTDTDLQTSTTLASTSLWYHIAVVGTSSTIKIYMDGVERASVARSTIASNTFNSWIGAMDTGYNSWNGYLDEFRISNSARYTAGFTPSTSQFANDANTTLLVHMNGANASTVFRDDNYSGTRPLPINVSNVTVSTAQSKFGGSSLSFTGTNSFIWIDQNLSQTGNFTVECWVRANNVTGAKFIFAMGAEEVGRKLIYLNGSRAEWDSYGAGGDDIAATAVTLVANTWYHFAAVRNSTTMTFYINGVSRGTNTVSGTSGNANGVWIGAASGGANSHNGYIDEIRLSNTARYTAGFTPSTTAFANDANTLLLIHGDGTNGSTTVTDSTT